MENKQMKWHIQASDQVATHLETSLEKGLDSQEVTKRLNRFGTNSITPKKRQSNFVRFLLQFHQPLIYILLAATAVTIFLAEYTDATVIFAVVLINSIIGYVQETKALKAIDALSKSMNTAATVIRNGKEAVINSIELVPGDIVKLKPGDKVPADVRLVAVKDLQIDESALTGESVATEKNAKTLQADAILGDQQNMGFATTVVTYGTGEGIVVTTVDGNR